MYNFTREKTYMKAATLLALLITTLSIFTCRQTNSIVIVENNEIKNGADQLARYLPLLQNKKVAIVANQASLVGNTHLVDTLLSLNIRINKIFCPEHGFRGTADAGKKIKDNIDSITNIPIVSLYGDHRKPTNADLKNIDIILFDLQDVGTRFYTYISTLTYVMEACAENNIALIVLDRPNPNGYFIDGPVLEKKYSSFVGLHPVPVVYGMTIGEYAMMVVGENWINNADDINLNVISLVGYNHNTIVKLKTKPSPNLPNWQSVYLYPSLCFFEGTVMSVGRGTEFPFQVFGHPEYFTGSFIFTPQSTEGATNPKYKNQDCYGIYLNVTEENIKETPAQINLFWLVTSYNLMNNKTNFFKNYFETLAGTAILREQIISGVSEEEIRKSWQPEIDNFKEIRSKYLIYP